MKDTHKHTQNDDNNMAKGSSRDLHNATDFDLLTEVGDRVWARKRSMEEVTIELKHKEWEGTPQKENK